MEKGAIILAPDRSALQKVFGIPVIRRIVLLARQAEIFPVHIIGQVDLLVPLLSDFLSPASFHRLEDASSLSRVVESIRFPDRARILALRADTVIDRLSLARLLETGGGVGPWVMGTGERQGNRQVYFGRPAQLLPILPGLWASEFPASKGAETLVKGAPGLPCRAGEDEEQGRVSEARLLAALSAQTEADDGFLARHVDRRISRFISGRVARTRVSPNHITLAGVATGLAGAFLFSQPGYLPKVMGSLFFLLCVILDGVDGEVARLKLRESRFGHYFDIVTDNVVHIALFSGIAIGLFRDTGDARYLQALWLLLVGFGACILAVYYCILRRTGEKAGQLPKTLKLMSLLSNRDFAYVVLVLAVADRLNWFLIGAAIGSYAFAGVLIALNIYENRTVTQQSP
ncbi:MAG: CDP-alcohol phosphatidyltransferase family protein [Deltaproteobacteria bacterium]